MYTWCDESWSRLHNESGFLISVLIVYDVWKQVFSYIFLQYIMLPYSDAQQSQIINIKNITITIDFELNYHFFYLIEDSYACAIDLKDISIIRNYKDYPNDQYLFALVGKFSNISIENVILKNHRITKTNIIYIDTLANN